ncbi:hypothetical protein FGO68_gene13472 [Halteria grandinella]|uniref:Uncharacterized protein n=1 Tax=Halteria grandinella TaxID=5974 RepID=A0A8J8NER7_HALGN|nr:hypothetical protein FGO68_gene13472 [Halteria grandinella]
MRPKNLLILALKLITRKVIICRKARAGFKMQIKASGARCNSRIAWTYIRGMTSRVKNHRTLNLVRTIIVLLFKA